MNYDEQSVPIKTNSTYILQQCSAICKDCHGHCEMLCKASGDNRSPWFYICWKCHTVAQIGKGMVNRDK